MHLIKTLTFFVATTVFTANRSIAHVTLAPISIDNSTFDNKHERKLCTQVCAPAPMPPSALGPVSGPAPAPVPMSGVSSPSNPSPIVSITPGTSTTTSSMIPGTSTTPSYNVVPGTINQQINIVPGSPATNMNYVPSAASPNINVVPAPAPPPPMNVVPAPAPPPPMYVAKPSPPSHLGTSGLNFGSLLGGGNPLTGAATRAHQAHGALLGHTGTVPSAYMQGQSGGHGH